MIQTETINITYVRKVLEKCPYFDNIVNYNYEYGDILSSKLIDWYRELVFSIDTNNNDALELISYIDKSLNMYVTDRRYKKGLVKIIDIEEISLDSYNLISKLIIKIIDFTKSYEKKKVLEITSCKWL